ncbi:glycerophosphodiester phosphodiesterase family protein [Amphritea sp.]|uniref:glycerophosphodiester phosphodiesterase family protein n=1 Tax=Amphritea sp. TaxID=1872502 RepID=UPI0035665DD0
MSNLSDRSEKYKTDSDSRPTTCLADRLVAHRGYASRYPENSLLAIERALASGAKFVEVDIQLTADLEPVLYHDRDMARLSGADNKIQLLTYDELERYSLHNPVAFSDRFEDEPISHLQHLVNLMLHYPEVTFFVEFKRVAIETFGVESCVERSLPLLALVKSQVVLISYSRALVDRVLLDGWQAGWVSDQFPASGWWQSFIRPPHYLILNYTGLRNVDLPAEKRGWPEVSVVLYEVADAELARTLFARGADLIETFAISPMRRALSQN